MKLRVEMSRRDGTTYVNVRGGDVEDSLELPPPRGGPTAVVADVDAGLRRIGATLIETGPDAVFVLRHGG